jgi:hypothetical protein
MFEEDEERKVLTEKLTALVDKYKADSKEFLGVEFREPMNPLQIASLILKLTGK